MNSFTEKKQRTVSGNIGIIWKKIVEERTGILKSTNEKLIQEIDERKEIESEREALISKLQDAIGLLNVGLTTYF